MIWCGDPELARAAPGGSFKQLSDAADTRQQATSSAMHCQVAAAVRAPQGLARGSHRTLAWLPQQVVNLHVLLCRTARSSLSVGMLGLCSI